MKSRKREVNIFNMSVLDLLTGALGAFCFLTLALFPSYYKHVAQQRDLAKVQAALKQAEKQENEIQQEIRNRKSNSKKIPQFALVIFGNFDQTCAAYKMQSVEVPPGAPAVDYQVISEAGPNGADQYMLFVFRPGEYRLVADATLNGPACTASALVMEAQPKETDYTLSRSGPAAFDFQITPSDFAGNLFQ